MRGPFLDLGAVFMGVFPLWKCTLTIYASLSACHAGVEPVPRAEVDG